MSILTTTRSSFGSGNSISNMLSYRGNIFAAKSVVNWVSVTTSGVAIYESMINERYRDRTNDAYHTCARVSSSRLSDYDTSTQYNESLRWWTLLCNLTSSRKGLNDARVNDDPVTYRRCSLKNSHFPFVIITKYTCWNFVCDDWVTTRIRFLPRGSTVSDEAGMLLRSIVSRLDIILI